MAPPASPSPLDWGDGYVVYRYDLGYTVMEDSTAGGTLTVDQQEVEGLVIVDGREHHVHGTLPQDIGPASYASATDEDLIIVAQTGDDVAQEGPMEIPVVPYRYAADPRNAPLVEEKYEPFSDDIEDMKSRMRFGLGRRLAPFLDSYVRYKLGCEWLSVSRFDDHVELDITFDGAFDHLVISIMTRVRVYAIREDDVGDERGYKACYNPPFPITAKDARTEWVDEDTLRIHVVRPDSLGDVTLGPLFPERPPK